MCGRAEIPGPSHPWRAQQPICGIPVACSGEGTGSGRDFHSLAVAAFPQHPAGVSRGGRRSRATRLGPAQPWPSRTARPSPAAGPRFSAWPRRPHTGPPDPQPQCRAPRAASRRCAPPVFVAPLTVAGPVPSRIAPPVSAIAARVPAARGRCLCTGADAQEDHGHQPALAGVIGATLTRGCPVGDHLPEIVQRVPGRDLHRLSPGDESARQSLVAFSFRPDRFLQPFPDVVLQ